MRGRGSQSLASRIIRSYPKRCRWGQPSILSDEHRQRLSEMIGTGPVPAAHGVVRWRLAGLMQWLWDEYRIRISKQTLSRELRALNFRKLSAHHTPGPFSCVIVRRRRHRFAFCATNGA
jgi:hypothetical protein